jgi:hypothetical protein
LLRQIPEIDKMLISIAQKVIETTHKKNNGKPTNIKTK